MSEPVKKKVRVLEARYIKEADSILILGEVDGGQVKQQINSSCFFFGDKNVEKEMTKLAEIMVGKYINLVFDSDLDGKIKDHVGLRY